jgi:general secretion pathway protein D
MRASTVKMLAGHRHKPRTHIQLVLALLGITSATALQPIALGHAQDVPPPIDAPPKEQAQAPAKDVSARERRREQRRAEAALRAPSAKPLTDAKRLSVTAPDAKPGSTPPATPAAPANQPPRTVNGPAAPLGQPGSPDVPPDPKAFETGLPYEPTPPRSMVTFNLEDASLTDLIRLISQITGRRFILPGTTRAIKATVYAPTKVSAAEAYQAFLSILELNGMTIVPAGRYLKVVESSRIEGRTIPLLTNDDELPEGDRFITRLQRVTSIPAEDAASLLERFKSGDGSITAYAPTNMLIITDTGTNIRRMLRILEVIDVAATGEQIWVEPVHHASATEVAARLSEIFEPSSGTGAKGTKKPATPPPAKPKAGGGTTETVGSGSELLTKILADERTNSLIIVATERSYLRILEMLKYLDVSMQGGGRIHVHHLQHTDAEEIASTLQSLVSGKGGAPKGRAGATPAAAPGGGEASDIFEGSVGITANKGSNAIVVTSSAHDYAALRPVIDLLDSARKQVFIEAVIMELSVDRNHTFGVAFHGGLPDVPIEDSVSVLGFRADKTIGGLVGGAASGELLTGLALGVQGPTIEGSQQQFGISLPGFGVAINALASSGDANILSTPHLIATDNVEAEISVGQNVPLQQTTVGGFGGLGALAGLGGLNSALGGTPPAGSLGALGALGGLGSAGGFGVPRQDVGTTVTITPHINDSNEIRLQISQEISSAGAPSNQGQGAVTIDRTRAKTEVVVRDQQTVVIGGLMRDQITTGDTKVPVLGDLPLIGALFKTSSKHKIKKNLLLFLTPYIIRSPDDLRSIYERKMRERQEFLDRYFVFGDDFAPAVDYSRTRGLVGEVLVELKLLDQKRQLLKDLTKEPGGTHDPRPPVGRALGESAEAGDEVIGPEDGPQNPAEQGPPAESAPQMPEPTPVEAPEATQ